MKKSNPAHSTAKAAPVQRDSATSRLQPTSHDQDLVPLRATTEWRLRRLMFDQGMFKTNELQQPLREHGIELSREQVYRLVTRPPIRLRMEILAALCLILDCGPNDLIVVGSAAGRSDKLRIDPTSVVRERPQAPVMSPIGDIVPIRFDVASEP